MSLSILKIWTKRYLNAYIYCAAIICALFLYPIYATRTPAGVDLITQGFIAQSSATLPSELSPSQWQPVLIPVAARYIASGKSVDEWFSVTLPKSVNSSQDQAILISSFPLGGTFFLGDKKIYQMDLGSDKVVTRNNLPIFLTLPAQDLEKSRTLYIKVRSIFSFTDLEPIYFGDSHRVHELFKNYLNWNVKHQHTVVIVSFIFMTFFLLAWIKNRDVLFFKNMFLLTLFWLAWEEIVLSDQLSIDHWTLWRYSNWFCIAGLLYYFVATGLLVVKIKVPNFLKYYFIFYAATGSFICWYDYEGTFLYTQLLIASLYLVLNYGALLIFYEGWREKSWRIFSFGLVFLVASPASVHDFIVWTGLFANWVPFLSSIGVPQYFLQSQQLSYLVAIPYLLVTGFTLLQIIEDKERYKTESAIATREERSRIIRDLHDGLGAVLTMGAIQAQSGTLTVEKAKVTITESLNDLRLILNGFDTEKPNMAAIVETIGEQAQRMFSGNKRLNISYQLPDVDEKEPKLSQAAAMNLAKITREALTNAAKYSGGTEIHVELKYSKTEVIVEVTDNGPTGFDFERSLHHPTGNGLNNMLSRAKSCGGTFTYISQPGETKMIATMPIYSDF